MSAEEYLAEVKARSEDTSCGPWVADGSDVRAPTSGDVAYDMDDVDAEFIAHARQDVPRLVAFAEAVLHLADLYEPAGESIRPYELRDLADGYLGGDS